MSFPGGNSFILGELRMKKLQIDTEKTQEFFGTVLQTALLLA